MTEQPPPASKEALAFLLEMLKTVPIIVAHGDDDAVARALDRFAERVCEQRVSAEREWLARLVEQIADPADDSDLGEEAADAFNAGSHKRSASDRLVSWNAVIAKAIRAPAERPAPPQQQDSLRGIGVEQPTQEPDRPVSGDLVEALDDLVHEYIALAIQRKQPIEYRLNPALVAAGKLVEEARDAANPIPSVLASTGEQPDCGASVLLFHDASRSLPPTNGYRSERVLARGWGEKKRHYVWAFACYEIKTASKRWLNDDNSPLWFEPIAWAYLPVPPTDAGCLSSTGTEEER